MGHEKGRDTTTRLKHNFGMARPEGYRKAVRLMDMAERFNLPVITFVDTAGLSGPRQPRSAARPRPSPARPSAAWPWARLMIATIVGEGGSAAPSPWPAATRC